MFTITTNLRMISVKAKDRKSAVHFIVSQLLNGEQVLSVAKQK